MIAVDTNILVYAHRQDVEWHSRAFALMAGLAEGRSSWAIPWPCVHEFYAITTRPRIFTPPTSMPAAMDRLAAQEESPSLVLIAETPGYWDVFSSLARSAKVSGPKIHDARIAAMCIHHGVRELLSADRDFSRYPELTARNPLVG